MVYYLHSMSIAMKGSLLPYIEEVTNFFKNRKETWDFFSSQANKENQLSEFKKELIQNTYQYTREKDTNIYACVDEAKEKLGLSTLTVHVYQAQETGLLNMSVVYLGEECSIIVQGDVFSLLSEPELTAIFAHELSHVWLFRMNNGDFETTHRILNAIVRNNQGEASYIETARLFQLYVEVFCDRGSLLVVEDISCVVSALLKITTGVKQMDASQYLEQIETAFSQSKETRSERYSHPENYLRAKAIELWQKENTAANSTIEQLIQGKPHLDSLDIFYQKVIAQKTNHLIQLLLKPNWMRTTLTLSHSKSFDINTHEDVLITKAFTDFIDGANPSIKNYFAFILLDFVTVDMEIKTPALGWALQLSEDLGMASIFEAIIAKENKYTLKKMKSLKAEALTAFNNLKEGEAEQVYE
jgi:hypothetical protein